MTKYPSGKPYTDAELLRFYADIGNRQIRQDPNFRNHQIYQDDQTSSSRWPSVVFLGLLLAWTIYNIYSDKKRKPMSEEQMRGRREAALAQAQQRATASSMVTTVTQNARRRLNLLETVPTEEAPQNMVKAKKEGKKRRKQNTPSRKAEMTKAITPTDGPGYEKKHFPEGSPLKGAPEAPDEKMPAEERKKKKKPPSAGVPTSDSWCLPVGGHAGRNSQASASNGHTFIATGSVPVFDDGLTPFRHLAHLPKQEIAASMLQKLAREFLPIIRDRGYDITAVTEMCCCGDGIDYELGGNMRRVQQGQKIQGHDQKDCGGYNRTRYLSRGRTRHSIHLRMRHPTNHNMLLSYQTLCDTMAHEIAHCAHQNHQEGFWKLFLEIKREHAQLVRRGDQLRKDYNAISHQQSTIGGFNIYGSSTGRLHSS